VPIPPQVRSKESWAIWLASLILVGIMAISAVLSFVVNFVKGTCFRKSKTDRPLFKSLWQTWETWQMVCYLHLIAKPLPGNVLKFTRYPMMLVKLDIVSVVPLFDYYFS
jgi:hypothetical protein